MKILNKFGLPEPLVKACAAFTREPNAKDLSVTELLQPPYMRKLTVDHFKEIEADVTERIWAIMGTAVHQVLEHGASDGALSEEKLSHEFEGVKVTGTPDHLKDGVLQDWKVCGVYKIILDNMEDWSAQLNCYRYLFEKSGFPVKQLEIVAIMRDWNKRELGKTNDYPPQPVVVIPIEMWDLKKTEEFILDRIRLHKITYPEVCGPKDRWSRPDTYAVMKPGAKRATRVFKDKFEAEAFLTSLDKPGSPEYELITRPGVDVRCEEYCSVAKWCPHYMGKNVVL